MPYYVDVYRKRVKFSKWVLAEQPGSVTRVRDDIATACRLKPGQILTENQYWALIWCRVEDFEAATLAAALDSQDSAAVEPGPNRGIQIARRVLLSGLAILLLFGLVRHLSEVPKHVYKPGTRGQISAEKAVWLTVKYRSTPVNVGTGRFEYWRPRTEGNVREAWWDTDNDYMLINLAGIVYQYCDFNVMAWTSFIAESNPHVYYDTLIKGYPWWDCRQHPAPTYP